MARVVLENVFKRFGKAQVIHGVDLEIEDLEFMVLVGPSGCGKSTLLRMVAGLEKISDGTIRIGDAVVNQVAPKDRGCAMVFQNYALYPHMNVFKNMSFGLKLMGTPRPEIEKRVGEAADILGIQDLLKRKPHELSGGQRQRVAMGRAIVRKPSVFLFDEPLSNLDAKLRNQMRIEIKRLHQKVRTTVIYVTHDQIEAMTLADRIVVLRDGRIEQVGTPLDVFERPANTFVAGFIGSPPMNLLPARIVSHGGQLCLRFNDAFQLPIPDRKGARIEDGQEVVMGLRTESLTLENGSESEGVAEAWKVEGMVDVVEPLGGETHLHMDFFGVKFIARAEGYKVVAPGATLKMVMNLDRLHIFDAASRQAIY
ncbi:MAG: sn-glycerol-3-phosphate ABC transporter ATP-binding protein UgpC [Desulfobacterales bacterium]|nr:sn-glycerol-3-phosphate ABC transporter ATP-binding protein UgpC [Desulfobacterales bacterium]